MGMTGKVRITTYKAGTDVVVRQTPWMRNLIVSSSNRGKNLVVQRLIGDTTYSLELTHGDIGTSTGSPTATSTSLGTPTARAIVALGEVGASVNEAVCQVYFADSVLANGTYTEFGLFVDGAAGTSTGQLFNFILFSTPYTKASGEDSTIEVVITIT